MNSKQNNTTNAVLTASTQTFVKPTSSGTGIAWTNYTWNPWVGCTKVSAACANCYAIRAAWQNDRRGFAHYKGLTQKLENGHFNWTSKVAEAPPHIFNKRFPHGSLVFVDSMSDFFHAGATDDMRLRALDVMRSQPDVAFQILTKRPEAISPFGARTSVTFGDNVWLGVTVESSGHLERLELLRKAPAAIRFVSIEPLLDDIAANGIDLTGVDWAIVGGESNGLKSRRMELTWARNIRDTCVNRGVPFFFKQWGAWRHNPLAHDEEGRLRKCLEFKHLDPHGMGGALLDGRLWREMPRTYWSRWAPLYKPQRRLALIAARRTEPKRPRTPRT